MRMMIFLKEQTLLGEVIGKLMERLEVGSTETQRFKYIRSI